MKTGIAKTINCQTGEVTESVVEIDDTPVPQSEPTPIEPTLEEKYEELQDLVAELLEVVSNG